MRKLLAIGTMLVLMLAAAAPAFAQTAVGGNVNLQYVDASQSQVATAWQVNRGNASATASGVASAANATISQGLNLSQSQWNGGVWGAWWMW